MRNGERSQDTKRLNEKGRKAELKSLTVPELRELARNENISGAGRLRKNELINELLTAAKPSSSDLDGESSDWLRVEDFGPFWLGVEWHVTQKLRNRAVSSLGKDWHRAQKVLRLYRVDWDDSGPHARKHSEDLPVPEQVSRWFVKIDGQSKGWKIELGYLTPDEKFFSLLHSADTEVASLQQGESGNSLKANEPQPRSGSRFTESDSLHLNIQGEISLNGTTHPGATVNIDDQSVPVQPRLGQFQKRSPLVDGRLFLPIVAEYGNQRLRAVVSIESNIHYLEAEKTTSDQ